MQPPVNAWMTRRTWKRQALPFALAFALAALTPLMAAGQAGQGASGAAASAPGVQVLWSAAPVVAPITLTPSGRTLVVGPGGTHQTLAAALQAASTGDTIRVVGGVHPGPLHIDRRVYLVGEGYPTIVGPGSGTVVRISAPGTGLSGFIVRGSGDVLEKEDTAIAVEGAASVAVTGNRIEDALFGIYVKQSPGVRITENVVLSKDLEVGRRGDAIKVWYSAGAELVNNTVVGGRDVIVWFSPDTVVRGNQVSGSRYGLHFMYSTRSVVEENVLSGNVVGAYFMNGTDFRIRRNVLADHHGSSGYGLALKDIDAAVVEENWIISNQIGIYMDNSPFSEGVRGQFRRNLLAGNHVAIGHLPSVRNNDLVENAFIDNAEQLSVLGRGDGLGNQYSIGGRGNFWSDYAGYDADGDGLGDLPYRPQSLYENLMDVHPNLRWFLNSPAVAAVDLAARAFPAIAPRPKLEDGAPLMSPPVLPMPPGGAQPVGRLAPVSLILLLGGALLTALATWGSQPGVAQTARVLARTRTLKPGEVPAR